MSCFLLFDGILECGFFGVGLLGLVRYEYWMLYKNWPGDSTDRKRCQLMAYTDIDGGNNLRT